MLETRSFTLRSHKGPLRDLKTECQVCAAFDPATTPAHQQPALCSFVAIWDTGATASVISPEVVKACRLKPIGMTQVHGVHGVAMAEQYLINIRLPNGLGVQKVLVTLGQLGGAQVLIGMDIITLGDFSITNQNGTTVFSFRHPSSTTVDYVEEHNRRTKGLRPVAPTSNKKSKRKRR
jgi:hypothetical protein